MAVDQSIVPIGKFSPLRSRSEPLHLLSREVSLRVFESSLGHRIMGVRRRVINCPIVISLHRDRYNLTDTFEAISWPRIVADNITGTDDVIHGWQIIKDRF
ncbi:hypothetical protein SAMN05216226_1343 [Halovenus aranensis]|uniref:Uncharacterized protein n=1 Tax=Halovenus aranensis TaxID=890420 RepID=A0A1G8ZSF0_9EURY|nr:hypothetical protein SAMN05216226_1343 [Halovenus aranensis]